MELIEGRAWEGGTAAWNKTSSGNGPIWPDFEAGCVRTRKHVNIPYCRPQDRSRDCPRGGSERMTKIWERREAAWWSISPSTLPSAGRGDQSPVREPPRPLDEMRTQTRKEERPHVYARR